MKHLLLTTIAAVVLVGTAFAGPIHDAAEEGDLAGVQAELDKGADVNAKSDWEGRTPLHYAADKGHKEVAVLLIAKGADVNAKSKGGHMRMPMTPLDKAKVSFFDSSALYKIKEETADLLREHGGKTAAELRALMPRLMQHGRFAFSFDAKEGKVYEVQDSFDLLNWEVIKTYTGTGSSVRFDEERDHDPPKWFYRVRVVE